MEWQPIETAPKDGTPILLSCVRDRTGKRCVALAWWDGGMWADAMYWSDADQQFSIPLFVSNTTHWMPLPTPPNAQSSDAGSQADQA